MDGFFDVRIGLVIWHILFIMVKFVYDVNVSSDIITYVCLFTFNLLLNSNCVFDAIDINYSNNCKTFSVFVKLLVTIV